MTAGVDDYVSRIEGTCGEGKDVVVTFKYDRKNEVIKKMLQKAKLTRSIAGVICELTFKGYSFRFYASGKAIFRDLKDKEELKTLLSELLSV